MKSNVALAVFICLSCATPYAVGAEEGKKTTTTQTAAEAAQRQGQQGTMNENAAKRLSETMKELDAQGKPAPAPSPSPSPSPGADKK